MKNQSFFTLQSLSVSIGNISILDDISLSCHAGSAHVIMGPNGSGKSSLAHAIIGHPDFTVTSGSIMIEQDDITQLSVSERARKGIFLSFQNPCHLPGVVVINFLWQAYQALCVVTVSFAEFKDFVVQCCIQLSIDPSLLDRKVNDGFSGGEKKKLEMLQLLLFLPRVVILDEIDSGLDVDSLKVISQGLSYLREKNPAMILIIITHYRRILEYISFDHVHIMHSGKLVASGNYSLVDVVETQGYDGFKKQ